MPPPELDHIVSEGIRRYYQGSRHFLFCVVAPLDDRVVSTGEIECFAVETTSWCSPSCIKCSYRYSRSLLSINAHKQEKFTAGINKRKKTQ